MCILRLSVHSPVLQLCFRWTSSSPVKPFSVQWLVTSYRCPSTVLSMKSCSSKCYRHHLPTLSLFSSLSAARPVKVPFPWQQCLQIWSLAKKLNTSMQVWPWARMNMRTHLSRKIPIDNDIIASFVLEWIWNHAYNAHVPRTLFCLWSNPKSLVQNTRLQVNTDNGNKD